MDIEEPTGGSRREAHWSEASVWHCLCALQAYTGELLHACIVLSTRKVGRDSIVIHCMHSLSRVPGTVWLCFLLYQIKRPHAEYHNCPKGLLTHHDYMSRLTKVRPTPLHGLVLWSINLNYSVEHLPGPSTAECFIGYTSIPCLWPSSVLSGVFGDRHASTLVTSKHAPFIWLFLFCI